MAPVAFAVGSGLKIVGDVVGGLQRAKAAIAAGEAAKRAAIKNAALLEDQASFVDLKTEEEIARFQDIQKQVTGSVLANQGASGFAISAGTANIIAANAITTQKDVDIIRLSGERESANLRGEAQLILEQGMSALSNAQLAAKGERLGAIFSGVGGLTGFSGFVGGQGKEIAKAISAAPNTGGGFRAPSGFSRGILRRAR